MIIINIYIIFNHLLSGGSRFVMRSIPQSEADGTKGAKVGECFVSDIQFRFISLDGVTVGGGRRKSSPRQEIEISYFGRRVVFFRL